MVTVGPGAGELQLFRRILADRLGWAFRADHDVTLARVLRRRAKETGLPVAEYLRQLDREPPARERTALAAELTITESYFFRNIEQFHALTTTVLPRLVRARGDQRRLRLLSVGCAAGEEPYSLAIVARQVQPDPAWDITVLGLDANPVALGRAAAGRYTAWSLRETPPAVRRRWFRRYADGYELDPAIRRHVRLQLHHVAADDDAQLWLPGRYDVVFCRNLLMYLTPAVADRLVQRMITALADDGYLFLGHTDTLGSRPAGLEAQHSDGAFFYRRRRDAGRAAAAPPVPSPPDAAASPSPPPGGGSPQATLVPGPARPAAGASGPVHTDILGLLRQERFAEAAEQASRAGTEPSARLLYAVSLALAGRLDDAAVICRRLLAADPLNADAHHLLGMCLEAGVQPEAAVAQYRRAAHLDPDFAMPRLRLGLITRRRGQEAAAGAELARAQRLLGRETDERILFFGGGFARTTLIGLCRTELDLCGVTG